jgi:hypothetical protein
MIDLILSILIAYMLLFVQEKCLKWYSKTQNKIIPVLLITYLSYFLVDIFLLIGKILGEDLIIGGFNIKEYLLK